MAFPPKLESRSQSTYSASTQLLITSKGEPYLSSTNVNAKIIKLPDSTDAPAPRARRTAPQQNSTYDSGSGADGDLAAPGRDRELAAPARDQRHGHPPAQQAVPAHQRQRHAVNPYAFSGAGGFREGPLPVHQDHGHGRHAAGRDSTSRTRPRTRSSVWFEGRQKVDKIKNPVIVEQVNSAEHRVRERRLEAAPGSRGSAARAARRRGPRARARPPDPAAQAQRGPRSASPPRPSASSGAGAQRPGARDAALRAGDARARGADDDVRGAASRTSFRARRRSARLARASRPRPTATATAMATATARRPAAGARPRPPRAWHRRPKTPASSHS